MAGFGNGGRAKNYEPNSFDGPVETGQPDAAPLELHGSTGTYERDRRETDDFTQAGDTLPRAQRFGMTIDTLEVVFRGRCSNCAERG